MTVRLTPEAVGCIAEVARYYRDLNPSALMAIRADIRTTFERFDLNPLAYPSIGRDDIRRPITRRYRYSVYFRIVGGTVVDVLSVRHPAERPRFPVDPP